MGKEEWKVYYSGNFCGHKKGERSCREIPVRKDFLWNGEQWQIPSVYTCPQGLVVEFCREIASERVRDFLKSWNLENGECREFSEEEQRRMEQENPLTLDFRPQVWVNGVWLRGDHGCSVVWNPCMDYEQEAKAVLEHYGYDAAKGWLFARYAFRWETKHAPKLREIRIAMRREPKELFGPHFVVKSEEKAARPDSSFTVSEGNGAAQACPGGTVENRESEIRFRHPVTGVEHRLKVMEFKEKNLQETRALDQRMEWPGYFRQMRYTLEPELSQDQIRIFDCAASDAPRRKPDDFSDSMSWGKRQKEGSRAAAINVIGGADGPTAVFLAGKGTGGCHAALSALHFETVSRVEWRISFFEKQEEDIEVQIELG